MLALSCTDEKQEEPKLPMQPAFLLISTCYPHKNVDNLDCISVTILNFAIPEFQDLFSFTKNFIKVCVESLDI